MTMMNGLDSIDLDMMDEEFFGPPPRFLVEPKGARKSDMPEQRRQEQTVFASLEKIRWLMGTR